MTASKGRPFHTPASLGAIIFNGLGGHDESAATLAPVLNFTVPHLPHSLLFGLASALVVDAAERETLLVSLRGTQAMEGGLCALMIYGCYEVCVLVFVTALHASALVAIGWWKIASSNAITLVTVFGYFRYRHRQILPRFAEQRGSSMQKQLRHRRSSLRRWSSYSS